MKKWKKILLGILIALLTGVAGFYTYLKYALPNVGPAPDITVKADPETIQRGKYLANHVMLCMDCHSTRDWGRYSAPMLTGTEGRGGEVFNKEFGFPGTIYSPNITPHRLENWTDGEIYRTITTGVSKSGQALFPVMPYHYYGQLDDEDIYAVIAYIRTLQPIESNYPARKLDFPISLLVNTIPHKAHSQKRPDTTDRIRYGKYMLTAAGCVECHTPHKNGQLVPGKEFIGGMEFKLPAGILRAPNITPDKNSGIGRLNKEAFVQKFKQYTAEGYIPPVVTSNDFQTVMPWVMYGGMTVSDLEAIYDYLQQLEPRENNVEKFTPKVN